MSSTERDVMQNKCRELVVKFSQKDRIANLKKKLTTLGVNVNDLVKLHGGPAIQTEGVHTEALRALIPEIVQQVVRTLQ